MSEKVRTSISIDKSLKERLDEATNNISAFMESAASEKLAGYDVFKDKLAAHCQKIFELQDRVYGQTAKAVSEFLAKKDAESASLLVNSLKQLAELDGMQRNIIKMLLSSISMKRVGEALKPTTSEPSAGLRFEDMRLGNTIREIERRTGKKARNW